jgi:hypothetical protein
MFCQKFSQPQNYFYTCSLLREHRDGILGHQIDKSLKWLLLHSTGGFYRQTLLKKPNKKIRETKKLKYIQEKHFVGRINAGRNPDKKSSMRRLEFMLRNLD